MARHRLRLAWLVTALAARPAPALDLPKPSEAWVAVEAGGLTVLSNGGDRAARETVESIDGLRRAIARLTKLTVQAPLPTKVYAFRNHGSFRPYAEALRPEAESLAGLFVARPDGNYVLLSDAGAAAGVVYHELIHHFLHASLADLPLWFDEGMAEFYSTFASRKGMMDVGRAVADHVRFLRGERLLPLGELFRIEPGSRIYNEGERRGVFYAQSWALIHYLFLGKPERRPQLFAFVDAVRAGKPQDEAFRAAFGFDYEELEKELRAYIAQARFAYVTEPEPEASAGQGIEAARSLGRADVLYELGDLLAQGGARTAADARRHLEAALEADPGHARAHAAVAGLLAAAGQEDEASARFEKAIAAGPDDAVAHLRFGQHLLTQVQAGRPQPGAKIDRARSLFRRCVELDPTIARAHAGLGATYVGRGEPGEGIAALERSLAMAPGQADAVYNLMVLKLATGARPEAERLGRRYVGLRRDPRAAEEVREALLRAELDQVDALVRADRIDEALARIEKVRAATSDPMFRTHLGLEAERLGRHRDEKREAEAIDRAVARANEGDIPAALAILDQLLPSMAGSERKEAAIKIREELARAQGATTKRRR